MNKLIVDKDNVININNNVLDIDILVNELIINTSGKVMLNDITSKLEENTNVIINVLDNSELIYNKFLKINKLNSNIVINLNNNSSVIYNYSIIANDKCSLVFDTNINNDNNKCEINIKGITENNGSLNIKATGNVKKDIKENELLENIRILTLNEEENIIEPNLLVSTNEVSVNHNATISSIDENYMFYLNSKGISNDEATKLIKQGYLLNNLILNNKGIDEIKELI